MKRYHPFLVVLHWVMGIAFLGMLGSGVLMTNFMHASPLKWTVYSFHKATGILLFAAVFIRLLLRFSTQAPPPSSKIHIMEHRLAQLGHWTLYLLMISIPLSGWIMSSAGEHPLSIFNLFFWPFFPGVAGNQEMGFFMHTAHYILGYLAIGVIALHIIAVIKHLVWDRVNLFTQMGIGRETRKK